MRFIDRRPVLLYGTLFLIGVVVGGIMLALDTAQPSPPIALAPANWVHVGLGAAALALLAWSLRRNRAGTAAFLREPLTATGWNSLVSAATWRGRLRPVAFVVTLVMLFTAFRAGVQVLGGLDPDFTGDAWGGPTYLGAMAAHYLDLVLIFLTASAIVRVAARRTGPAVVLSRG